ncbi:outer membrane protein assembly factor BamA [Elusimicrobiota bacterium]
MNNRLKILLLLLSFLGMSLYPLHSQEIVQVVIEGNKKVPDKDIIKNMVLKKGSQYDPVKAGEDLSSIYDMGMFDDVSVLMDDVSSGTIRVIYRVEEKPVIKSIEFKGNQQIKSKKLAKKIELKKKEFFDEFMMEDDIIILGEFYKKEGFAECSVEAYSTPHEEDNTISVTFYVNEGNKIKIKEIKLVGIVQEKYKKVRKKIKSKKGKVYKKDLLDEDKQEVISHYKNSGYLNVELEGPVITYDPEHKYMYVTFFVEEGNKYYINEMTFSGNMQLPFEELIKAVRIKKDDIYSEKDLETAMFMIRELYGTDGYIKMSVLPHFYYDDINHKVNIDFEILEGPKVYVQNIYVDGNYVTRDYVIEREFKLKEGDPFNLNKVRATQAQIYKLGFFSDVQVEMLPTGFADKTDLVFIVEEQKTGMASVGAGYSSVDKLVGTLRVSQENLFGRGQKLAAMWEFGTGDTKKQNYRIDFTEPYMFNTPTPFGLSVYNTSRRRFVGDFDYREQRSGGSVTVGRHLTDDFTGYMKYSLEQIKIHEVSSAIEDDVDEGDDTTSSVTPSIIYDTRDYPFDPSKGYYLKASNQIAGGILGGDRDFIKFEFQGTYFQPIFWRVVGVLNFISGAVSKYSDSKDVPIYERFNVGGAESIRGYDYWEIGPPEGGRYKNVVNFEIKFPIVSEKRQTILQGAFFYDIGSAWKDASDIILKSGLEEDKLKRGYGFGIRFKTQAFPIRLDWGYGVDKHPKDSQWYFTLGDIF